MLRLKDESIINFSTQVGDYHIWGMPFYTEQNVIEFDRALRAAFMSSEVILWLQEAINKVTPPTMTAVEEKYRIPILPSQIESKFCHHVAYEFWKHRKVVTAEFE